jgi:phage terminase small subunit
MPARRKPLKILDLSKSCRPSRHADRVPDLEPDQVKAPTPPDFIKGEALAEWDRVSELMAKEGTICELHRAALTQYCLMWGALAENCHSNDSEPLSAAFHTAFRWASTELGITPASRSKVPTMKPKQKSGFSHGRL